MAIPAAGIITDSTNDVNADIITGFFNSYNTKVMKIKVKHFESSLSFCEKAQQKGTAARLTPKELMFHSIPVISSLTSLSLDLSNSAANASIPAQLLIAFLFSSFSYPLERLSKAPNAFL